MLLEKVKHINTQEGAATALRVAQSRQFCPSTQLILTLSLHCPAELHSFKSGPFYSLFTSFIPEAAKFTSDDITLPGKEIKFIFKNPQNKTNPLY